MCTASAFAGNGINQITGYTGLGEGGYALINKGALTSDGSGALDLYTGAKPDAFGTVSYILNSFNFNLPLPQSCVYSYALQSYQPGEAPSYWPLTSQIGWLSSDGTTGETVFYWRAAELLPNSHYVVLFVCPPRVPNFNAGK